MFSKSHASEFIGIQESMYLMNQMQKNFGELVREVTRNAADHHHHRCAATPGQRGDIDPRSEDDSEALVEWGQREKDAIMLAGTSATL